MEQAIEYFLGSSDLVLLPYNSYFRRRILKISTDSDKNKYNFNTIIIVNQFFFVVSIYFCFDL